MFLLDDVLLAPLKGVIWLGEKVRQAVIAQAFDPDTLWKRLDDLEAELLAGRLTEAEFQAQEREILAAIEIARELKGD